MCGGQVQEGEHKSVERPNARPAQVAWNRFSGRKPHKMRDHSNEYETRAPNHATEEEKADRERETKRRRKEGQGKKEKKAEGVVQHLLVVLYTHARRLAPSVYTCGMVFLLTPHLPFHTRLLLSDNPRAFAICACSSCFRHCACLHPSACTQPRLTPR